VSPSNVPVEQDNLQGVAHEPARQALTVVVFGHVARLSGGEVQLARVLPALGSAVTLRVVLAEDGPLVEELRRCGVSAEVVPMSPRARRLSRLALGGTKLPFGAVRDAVVYSLVLSRRLREIRPDVVHTATLKAALYGGVAARLAGCSCVWQINDLIDRSYLPALVVLLVRGASRILPDVVVANSATTRASLRQPPGRVRVVYPPAPGWRPPAAEPSAPFQALMVGRLAPWKGQEVFLRAFADAFPRGPERAVVVGAALFGEDHYADRLHRVALDLGLAGRVEFCGFCPDVAERMATASVVVHASLSPEPFGQVVLEAMSLGRPVIASDAGGPREMVTDGVDGLLCTPGDVEAYARALRLLAARPEIAAALGARARTAAFRFSLERSVAGMLRAYAAAATVPRWATIRLNRK
jgi:glycosyltransferase involved in cell wall biosynthesis